MALLKNIRVYLRAAKGYSLERQRADCEAAIAALDLPHVVYAQGGLGGGLDDRERWITALRSDEIAVVPRLDLIARPKVESGRRPLVDFTVALATIRERSAYLLEACTGVTSDDGKRWLARVEASANLIAHGRTLRSATAKKMAAKSAKVRRKASIVRQWRLPDRASDLLRWQQHWRDPAYSNAEEAWDALPDDVRADLGSIGTARRVLGRRLPGKRNIGRPRKAAKRKQR